MTFTLTNAAVQFGVGTTVSLYKQAGPVVTLPSGTPLETAVVQANGTLTFTTVVPEADYVATANGRAMTFHTPAPARPSKGHAVSDEGVVLPDRSVLALVGAAVSASDDAVNDRTLVTVSGGGGVPAGWVAPSGLVGDGVTDNAAAIQAALDSPSSSNPWSGTTVILPPGNFFCSTTILIRRAGTIFMGSGRGRDQQGQSGITQLLFPDGVTGVKVVDDTAGGGSGQRGDWSVIENMQIRAQGNNVAGAHGVQIDFKCWVRNLWIGFFSGHGIYINAGVPNQNANNWRIDWTRVEGCQRNGFSVSGGDSNAGMAIGLDCSSNGGWGIAEQSFLGNTYVACHTDANGAISISLGNATSGSNQITGVTRPQLWSIGDPITVKDPVFPNPAIVPAGTTVTNIVGSTVTLSNNATSSISSAQMARGSGGYMSSGAVNISQFLNCYTEGGQAPNNLNAPTFILGGVNMTGGAQYNAGNAAYVSPGSGAAQVTIPAIVTLMSATFGRFDIGQGGYPWQLHSPGDADIYYMQWDDTGKQFAPLFNNAPVAPYSLTGAGATVSGRSIPGGQLVLSQGFYWQNGKQVVGGGDRSAAPSTGAHKQGDIVFNFNPIAGGKVGWICTADGTPGTWKAFGAIDP